MPDSIATLPDYLREGLDLVLIGINPGLYSAMKGHYFARKNNRFWPAFSSSRLSLRVRIGLGINTLFPEHDCQLPQFGIGLTDVVKRPTPNASGLTEQDFAEGVPELIKKLRRLQPRVACFHGVTAYRAMLEYGWQSKPKVVQLGKQNERVARTTMFVIPNPSPANAHFTPGDLVEWHDRLADFVASASE